MNIRGLSAGLTLAAALSLVAAQAFAQQGGGRGGFQLAQVVVESDAFEDGGIIPDRFVSRGENVQPGFTLSNLPENAVSIAIIFHDLDVALGGGTEDVFHWSAWNIPAAAGGIPEGGLPDGAVNGPSIRGQPGYVGPGAPAGPRYHHYVFEFYVLNDNLDLPNSATRDEILAAMEGKVVGKAAYVGRYRGSE
ncbi:MAG TPA: YbhB/YbcL family Raf kinase inhibitor-like protein [Gammaproteobacteria bacterium]|nr:YbhB/YbcL family Raf kinase inhibitor-like protein [Gammaproteobacteria bacterium]